LGDQKDKPSVVREQIDHEPEASQLKQTLPHSSLKDVFITKVNPYSEANSGHLTKLSNSNPGQNMSGHESGSWVLSIPEPSPETQLMILQSVNAVNAMFCISEVMQLNCTYVHRTYTAQPTVTYPPSLTPTKLQAVIAHHAYVDMIPFPILRDRILEALQTMNEEELCKDLVTDEWKIWGNKPWEPRSWEMPHKFVHKWWFLLDEDILAMTNFWRQQRSEEPLSLPKMRYIEAPNIAAEVPTVV
jgi:hypothetical protein